MADIFGSYIDALKAQRAKRAQAQAAGALYEKQTQDREASDVARRRQEMEIVTRSGGGIRTGQELDQALRMTSMEAPRRSMDEALEGPTPTAGPARPYAPQEEMEEPLTRARFQEGLAQMADPWRTVGTVAGPDDTTLVLPKTYTSMPRVIKPATGGSGGSRFGADVTLTKAGIDLASKVYLQTGKMPPLGMGSAGNRAAVISRAAELSKNPEGAVDTTKMIVNAMVNKANSMSYAQLQKQADNIEAFEKTARKNADLALHLADRVTRTGVPFVNKWWNATQRELANNPDLAAFDLGVRTFINEYARITTSVTGGGILSDTARKEVEDLLQAAQTPEAFKRTIETAFIEMENRIKSHAEQFQKIRERSESRTRVPLSTDKAPAAGDISKEDFEAWKNRRR